MQRAFGLDIPETLEELCDPRRMAVLVYDMQVGVLSQIAGAKELTARVVTVVEAARRAGMRVVFVRHMTLPLELTGVKGFRTAMVWQRRQTVDGLQSTFPPGSPQYHLTPELAPRPNEAVFDKVTMSAFAGTPLDIVFRDCKLETFAIVGVATEVGIEPTVRHASDLGYVPVIITDACAAGHEPAGQRALESLEFAGDSVFTTVEELCAVLKAPTA